MFIRHPGHYGQLCAASVRDVPQTVRHPPFFAGADSSNLLCRATVRGLSVCQIQRHRLPAEHHPVRGYIGCRPAFVGREEKEGRLSPSQTLKLWSMMMQTCSPGNWLSSSAVRAWAKRASSLTEMFGTTSSEMRFSSS